MIDIDLNKINRVIIKNPDAADVAFYFPPFPEMRPSVRALLKGLAKRRHQRKEQYLLYSSFFLRYCTGTNRPDLIADGALVPGWKKHITMPYRIPAASQFGPESATTETRFPDGICIVVETQFCPIRFVYPPISDPEFSSRRLLLSTRRAVLEKQGRASAHVGDQLRFFRDFCRGVEGIADLPDSGWQSLVPENWVICAVNHLEGL